MAGLKRIEDFDVFNRAYALSLKIHKISLEMPKFEQLDFSKPTSGVPLNQSVPILRKVSQSKVSPNANLKNI
ncbi:hypothetical protein LEP1GSC188_3087 [Leptospira weilii serovar Topaz str. LT2116]|uniref:Uncharacterized protein n=1 Tax=Leptospira weilii serovar Topaz str. LT2116 TaxID=1088540 RepID=M3EPG6_9LEPT|nr:hypothetical protein LEP1GSC188_3087 [Leptospira weilii serovar Topaz str. LT2116]